MKIIDWQRYFKINHISHALSKPLCIINLTEFTEELCVLAIAVVLQSWEFGYIIKIMAISNDTSGNQNSGFSDPKNLKAFTLLSWALGALTEGCTSWVQTYPLCLGYDHPARVQHIHVKFSINWQTHQCRKCLLTWHTNHESFILTSPSELLQTHVYTKSEKNVNQEGAH